MCVIYIFKFNHVNCLFVIFQIDNDRHKSRDLKMLNRENALENTPLHKRPVAKLLLLLKIWFLIFFVEKCYKKICRNVADAELYHFFRFKSRTFHTRSVDFVVFLTFVWFIWNRFIIVKQEGSNLIERRILHCFFSFQTL